MSDDLVSWLFDLRNVFYAALRSLFSQFQFSNVVLVLLTRLHKFILNRVLLVSGHVCLDWDVTHLVLEVVPQICSVTILANQVFWHWHPGHLCASFEDKKSLFVHEITKLLRVRDHQREQPVAAIMDCMPWNEVAHVGELF